MRSSWRPIRSSVPQRSILGLILFNIFINDRVECTLSKFREDAKLGRGADTPEGQAATRSNLERLEKWSDKMNFKEKSKVLYLRKNNPMHQWRCTWKTAVQKRPWGSWQTRRWTLATNVPLGRRGLMVFWAALRGMLSAGKEDDPFPLLSTGEAALGHRTTRQSPVKGH